MTDYVMKSVTKVQFCAHDENETTLQRVTFKNLDGSVYEKHWSLTDKRGLSINFASFTDALINMCIMTDTDFEDFTIL